MIIPILILVLSVLFIFSFINHNFLNSTKKILLHIKKPFLSSHEPPLHPTSSPKENPTNNKDDDDDDDLKRVFDTFDKNGDGFITKEEFKESLSNMGMNVLPKDVEEMVDNLDSNKDGLVDVDEFKELYGILIKGKEENIHKEGKNGEYDNNNDDEEDLKEAFNVFDGNNDGLITVEELGLVLNSLGLKQGNREEDCKEMINKVDVDGDGMVNFEEFKVMMRARCSNKSSKVVHAF